jgi:CheY-like chemotaxis protein
MVVQMFLQAMPYRLDMAENGAVAVDKFRAGHYDLVLMDMQMPVMDGYSATVAIRQWEHDLGLPPTPIIALTAYALQDDMHKSAAAGCTAYLTKPIKKATLLGMIFVQTKDLPEPALEPCEDRVASCIVHAHPDIVELMPEFLDGMKKYVVTLREALAQGDYDTVTTLGHRIRGDGGSFGFEVISTYGAALEQAARCKNAEVIGQSITELADYLEHVRVVMD